MRNYALLAVLFFAGTGWSEGDVPAAQLLSVLSHGTSATSKLFKTDDSRQPDIEILELNSDERAIFYTADMDIDCDGEPSDSCNSNEDPWFYPGVSAGIEVYAQFTPFYVVPVSFHDYVDGVHIGSVAAVIYDGTVGYGPMLDECGITDVIGEASFAMADVLDINHNPRTGGTSGPVTYIIFTGSSGELDERDYTDHDRAIEVGSARAQEIVEFFNVSGIINPLTQTGKSLRKFYSIALPTVAVTATGRHTITIFTIKGQRIIEWRGEGARKYTVPALSPGLYILSVTTPQVQSVERIVAR